LHIQLDNLKNDQCKADNCQKERDEIVRLLLTFTRQIRNITKLYSLGDTVNPPSYGSDRRPEGMGRLAVSGLMT